MPEIIHCSTRAEWLKRRRESIGASESPAILGVGYADQSPLTIYESKVSDAEPVEHDDIRLRIGQLMEPALRSVFEEVTGMDCVIGDCEMVIQRHEQHQFISATLDDEAYSGDEWVPVELKNVDRFAADEWQDDRAPLKYQVQVQHQLLVTGASHGYLFGLIGGNDPQVRRIEADPAFHEVLIDQLTKFWRHVETRTPPPVDASEATARALARIWPKDCGKVIDLPDEAAALAERIETARQRMTLAKTELTAAENELKAILGDAAYGRLPDGSGYSWRTQERKAYAVEASTCRVLRRVKRVPLSPGEE